MEREIRKVMGRGKKVWREKKRCQRTRTETKSRIERRRGVERKVHKSIELEKTK